RKPHRVVVDQDIRPELDRVDPLRRRTRGHAWNAIPVRLLLQATRVGDEDARLRDERRHVEVAERLEQAYALAESDAGLEERAAGTRMGRKDDGLLDRAQAGGDAPQARLAHVGLAVDRRDDVPAGRDAES